MPSIIPFDDSTTVDINFRSASVLSGSNLGDTEQFRQGIELRNENDHYQGTVKIHAGYPRHELPQNQFGQTRPAIAEENWFLEIDAFDAVNFISYRNNSNVVTASALTAYDGTFPRISSNAGSTYNESMDGTLEPFTIRARASFFSVEGPFESHDIHAVLADGNEEKGGSNDQVITVYELDNRPNASTFLDSADVIGNVAVMGDYEPNLNAIIPWPDTPISSGSLVSNNMDTQLRSVVQQLGSWQDNYVPSNKKSMPSGFVYDTAEGTDSLAFGGFYYISSSVSSPPMS